MTSASDVGICNSALVKIGVGSDGRISSLTEGTKNANICNEQYAKRRDALLRSHTWNFATTRTKLSRLTETPAFEFNYKYQLPSDYLRVVSVHDNDNGYGGIPYKIEGITILCDAEDVYLRYIKQVTDPAVMSADFREYLATDMAYEMVIPLAQSNTVKEGLVKDLKRTKRVARSIDALEDYPEEMPAGTWITKRN